MKNVLHCIAKPHEFIHSHFEIKKIKFILFDEWQPIKQLLPFRATGLFEWFLLFFFFFFSSFVSLIYFSISSLLNGLKEGRKKKKTTVAAVPLERRMTHSSARHRFVLYMEQSFFFNISFITFLMLIYIRGVYFGSVFRLFRAMPQTIHCFFFLRAFQHIVFLLFFLIIFHWWKIDFVPMEWKTL